MSDSMSTVLSQDDLKKLIDEKRKLVAGFAHGHPDHWKAVREVEAAIIDRALSLADKPDELKAFQAWLLTEHFTLLSNKLPSIIAEVRLA